MQEGRRGPRLTHIPALDGLRGAAVAGVVAFHAGHLTGGYLGVDAFFVLSGFLITSLLLAEWEGTEQIRLGAFWARRARRLLPALFGVLVGVAVYAAVFAAPSELDQIRGDALATVGYVANWRAVLTGASYWAQFRAPSPLEHTWSLAIEEQFYLVWPLVLVAVLRWRRGSARAVMTVALVTAGASAVWMAVRYRTGGDPSRVYLGTDTRAAAVLLGAALAALLAWRGPTRSSSGRRLLEVSGWIGALALLAAWARVGGETAGLYRGGLFLCGIAVVAVIGAVVHPQPGPLAGVLGFRPLGWLGIISYGVYLWHWPVYVTLTPERAHLDGLALSTLRIGVTLLIATTSFFVLERPIRRGALGRFAPRVWAPASAAAALAVLVAVLVATIGSAPVVEAATLGRDPIPQRSAPAGTTRLMVVGDSVAASLADGLKAHHQPWRAEVLNRSLIACVFVTPDGPNHDALGRVVKRPRCAESWRDDVERYRPDVVLITLNGDWTRDRKAPCSVAYDQELRARLREAVATLSRRGAKVAIVNSSYPSVAGSVAPRPVRDRLDCLNGVEATVARETGARLVDLNGYLCPAAVCRIDAAGEVLRPDGLHYGRAAGATVGQWVLRTVLGAPSG